MDALTFIVEMTKALAWPASIAFAVFLLRAPLIDLLPFIEELKYKDFELKFRKGVSNVKIASELSKSQQVPLLLEEENSLLRVAEVSPRAAVMESWMSLQDALLDISLKLGKIDNKENYREHSRTGHVMLDINAFTKIDFDAYHKLRSLRNQASHVPDFALNSQDAKEYVKLAMQLASVAKQRVNT